MQEPETNFNVNNIHSVELNLLDGQVDIILRGLELYGYNLDYMLNSTDSNDDIKQEKLALLRYTYEQVLSSRAEQQTAENSDSENKLSQLGKILLKENAFKEKNERKFKIV